MNAVKVLLIILAGLALIGGAVWHFWLKDQVVFADIASAYGAKQVCSCHFVADRALESCLGDFTEDVSQISFTVTASETTVDGVSARDDTVTARVLGGLIQNQARYEPGLGCTLVPS